MADKRTEQANVVHQRLVLLEALRAVACCGHALFDAESRAEDRKALGQWMRRTFPGDAFAFWRRHQIPRKADLEALGLLDALRVFVEGQARRLARSRSLVEDPLSHFRRLYRGELLGHVPEDEVRSPWRLTGDPDAVRGDRARCPDEETDVPFDEEMLKTAVGGRIKREMLFFLLGCRLAAARGEDDKDGPAHLRAFLLLRGIEKSGLLRPEDPDASHGGPASVEGLQERIRRLEAEQQSLSALPAGEWTEQYVSERTPAEVLEALSRPPCLQCEGLSDGEYVAVSAALRAILHGASPFSHSRRGDALSHYLTPSQARQLRRACARCGEVKGFVEELASRLAKVGELVLPAMAQPRDTAKRARGRIGHLTSLARQAERSGDLRIAAGLRARMKWESGKLLDDEDPELMREADAWLLNVWRRSFLASLGWVMVPVEDLAGAAGLESVRSMLLLAVFSWPEGAAASFLSGTADQPH